MAENILEAGDLTWSPPSGDFRLGPVSLQATAGRFTALLGPNGAGKSSFLNLAVGMTRPDSGGLKLCGRPLAEWPANERGRFMAFLPQDPERSFGFSLFDYVSLGRYPYIGPFGRPGKEDDDIVRNELNVWGLEDLVSRDITTLSGGEFQRARLARAFCQEPRILFLDEPGNHLDFSARALILDRLRREARRGCCIMAVLHDLNDALLYADEVLLFSNGRVIHSGEPEDVLTPETVHEAYGLRPEKFESRDKRYMLGIST